MNSVGKSSIATPIGLLLVLCFFCARAHDAKAAPRVQGDGLTVAELAAKIASAETADERKTLLEQHKGLVTVELNRALLEQANRIIKSGNPNRALDIFRLVGELGARTGDQASVAEAHCGMGYIHYLQGDYPAAIEQAREGLGVSERTGYKPGMACSLNNLGRVDNNQGRYNEALANFEKALGLEQEIGDRIGMAKSLNAMGVSRWYQGDFTGALEYYNRSLRIGREIGDKVLVANTLHNLGLLEKSLSNYQPALGYLGESLKLRESEKQHSFQRRKGLGPWHPLSPRQSTVPRTN